MALNFAAPRLYKPSRLTLLGSKIRMVLKDDEPWFVAVDVCRVLGERDAWSVVRTLEDDEKTVLTPDTAPGILQPKYVGATNFEALTDSNCKISPDIQPLIIISLSGFFSIVFRSHNKDARVELRKWVANRIMSSPVVNWRYDGGNVLDRFDPDNVRLALDALEIVLASDSRNHYHKRGRRPRYILNFRNNEVLLWNSEVGAELLREVQFKLVYYPFKGTWTHEIESEFLRNKYDPATGEVFRNVRLNPNIDKIEFTPRGRLTAVEMES